MSKVTLGLNIKRAGPERGTRVREALADFFEANFSDVIRQVERSRSSSTRRRLEGAINSAITIELLKMQRFLVGPRALIGGSIASRRAAIPPGEGPRVFKGLPRQASYKFVEWKPHSPAYLERKREAFPSNWKRWFLATGALRTELEQPGLLGVGGLRDTISVRLSPQRKFRDSDVTRLSKQLSSSQKGSGADSGAEAAVGSGTRSRIGRLRLLDVRVQIFNNLTPRELPYLGSRDLYDVNSGGAILEKLNLSKDAKRKLGPPTTKSGYTLQDRYRPVFEPLLTFWMANRIPAAVARVLYDRKNF